MKKENIKKNKVCLSRANADKRIEKMDETEYLLSSPANKDFLLNSIKQANEGKVCKGELVRL